MCIKLICDARLAGSPELSNFCSSSSMRALRMPTGNADESAEQKIIP